MLSKERHQTVAGPFLGQYVAGPFLGQYSATRTSGLPAISGRHSRSDRPIIAEHHAGRPAAATVPSSHAAAPQSYGPIATVRLGKRTTQLPWRATKPARHTSLRLFTLEAVDQIPHRSRVEDKMRCLKAVVARISAPDPCRQTTQIDIRVTLIMRFNTLGTAEAAHVA